LKDEITNIAMRIVKAREAKSNMVFNSETGKFHGTWKVPQVEIHDKTANEDNRYFNYTNYSEQRKTGLKFVPPPVGLEYSLDHLRKEQEVFDSFKSNNFYSVPVSTSAKKLPTFPKEDIISLLSGHTDKYHQKSKVTNVHTKRVLKS
jgi:hypothetical protein